MKKVMAAIWAIALFASLCACAKNNTSDIPNIKVGDVLPNGDQLIQETLDSAKDGDPMGVLNIGVSYKYGANGYPKDLVKAKRIFETVIDIAPGSQAAGLAKVELQDM